MKQPGSTVGRVGEAGGGLLQPAAEDSSCAAYGLLTASSSLQTFSAILPDA
ncbi:MAG: hypothetical protein ACTSUS_05070 [Candidatus Freyarchaeota archaeon]